MCMDISCLNVFISPKDKAFNKNIWDNCALIISEKEDEFLSPYLTKLINWLQDMNCPGTVTIFDRLINYKNYKLLNDVINERIIVAKVLKDEIWLSNIIELISLESLKKHIDITNYKIIPRYIE